MTTLPAAAERYLRDLERALSSLPSEDRAEIVAEIRAHLLDRAAAAADPAAAFGSPVEYAACFVQERALAGALGRGSSWALGRALVTGAGRLTWWYVVAVLWLAHVWGLFLIALAVLKPLFPRQIGLFAGAHLVFGAYGGPVPDGVHEVLGWWGIPFFLVPGVLVLWGAHRLLRLLAAWRLGALRQARGEAAAGA